MIFTTISSAAAAPCCLTPLGGSGLTVSFGAVLGDLSELAHCWNFVVVTLV